jgi:hypothetical protein
MGELRCDEPELRRKLGGNVEGVHPNEYCDPMGQVMSRFTGDTALWLFLLCSASTAIQNGLERSTFANRITK